MVAFLYYLGPQFATLKYNCPLIFCEFQILVVYLPNNFNISAKMAEEKNLVTAEEKQEPMEVKVESLIRIVRGKQVMLDRDLAELYGVETKYLKFRK